MKRVAIKSALSGLGSDVSVVVSMKVSGFHPLGCCVAKAMNQVRKKLNQVFNLGWHAAYAVLWLITF